MDSPENHEDWLRAFQDDLGGATLFAWWVSKNPNEAAHLNQFIADLEKGDRHVSWPRMATPMGRVLVRAAAACASHRGPPTR
jgi:hypothetical protein